MLSILIPIYNFNVEDLVTQLVAQCKKEKIAFEILCFDDHSRKKYRTENHVVSGKFGVSYIELSENYGRSKIRNTLAKNARYEYMLFIDCDSKVVSDDYIATYIDNLDPKCIINGGRIYKPKKPRSLKKRLHWKYGTVRESLSVKERDKKGSSSFHSNNFIVPKSIITQFPFNTEVQGYGYEDVVFADMLVQNRIKIKNIDNPVEHLGIEMTDKFLKKTDEALRNLVLLNNDGLVNNVKLIQYHKKILSWKLMSFTDAVYKVLEKKIMRNLYSENPSLKLFDLYRIHRFNEFNKESHINAENGIEQINT